MCKQCKGILFDRILPAIFVIVACYALKEVWDAEKKIEAITMFIAFLGFGVAWKQSRAMDVQNKLSVKPYLNTRTDVVARGPREKYVVAILENVGLGAAIVDDYYIVHEGKKHRDGQISEMCAKVFKDWTVSEIRPGFAIPVNGSLSIVEIPIDLSTNIDALQEQLRNEFELHIKFHSLLDEPFDYNSKQDHAWRGLMGEAE